MAEISENEAAIDNKLSHKICHYEELRRDARDEMKMRIKQRDLLGIQSIVAIATIITLAVSFTAQTNYILLLVPLVVIYFTALISYSYQIHDILVSYLKDQIEPAVAQLVDIPNDHEWIRYYYSNKSDMSANTTESQKDGIRRKFFKIVMVGFSIVMPSILTFSGNAPDQLLGIFFLLFYASVSAVIAKSL